MDPFLPGDIPVMILRYLTVNKCETAALAFLEEMPMLKSYIPPKPPKVSFPDYLKHLSRCSVNPSLKDILFDFGYSKILAEEILEHEHSSSPSHPSDTLITKIKSIQNLLRSQSSSLNNPQLSIAPARFEKSTATTQTVNVERFTNTDDSFRCSQCIINQTERNPRTDSSCQTDEVPVIQFDYQDEIPVIFYKTLLNDDSLQQNIAQTINEHLHHPEDQRSGDVLQKISSKAEPEIDKFLVNILQDVPNNSNHEGIVTMPNVTSEPTYNPDSNLGSMFRDAEQIIRTPTNLPPNNVQTKNVSFPPLATKEPNMSVESSSSDMSLSLSSSNASPSSPTHENPAPRGSTRNVTVKRITPTPLPNANVNPVFNASVVVKDQVFATGSSRAKASVVSITPEIPTWQKLCRKPITPKIPGFQLLNKEITVIDERSDRCKVNASSMPVHEETTHETKKLKLNQDENVQKDILQNVNSSLPVIASTPPVKLVESSNIVIPLTTSKVLNEEKLPTGIHKRKATPVKLTPDKAGDVEYNFIHVYHESNKSTASAKKLKRNSNCDERADIKSIKNTPVPSTLNDKSSVKVGHVLQSENSQAADVTPMQFHHLVNSTNSYSDIKTISPNALQRLIASATKLESTTSALTFQRKKSFSTPRKRHVRSLTFATPPSLHTVTPASEDRLETNSRKRKATEDVASIAIKSKKRLDWPENDKHKQPNNSDEINDKQVNKIPLPETHLPPKNPVQETGNVTLSITSTGNVQVVSTDDTPGKHMSTILEESSTRPQSQTITFHSVTPVLNPSTPVPTTPIAQNNLIPTSSILQLPFNNDWTPLKATKAFPVQVPASANKFQCFQMNNGGQAVFPVQFITSGPQQIPTTPWLKHVAIPPEIPLEENSVFNIVPAPLGFPEPTPIKFFGDTSNLNISDIGFRSPLITPLKPYHSIPFNETHLSLPPTPRMLEAYDSNSNSLTSVKRMFDGCLYSNSLLTSTPMKAGVPKTPGRECSSNNSQTPFKTDGNALLATPLAAVLSKPIPQLVPKPIPQLLPKITPQTLPKLTPQIISQPLPEDEQISIGISMNLSSLEVLEKSDGELSSSSDEKEEDIPTKVSQKQVQKVVPYSPIRQSKSHEKNAHVQTKLESAQSSKDNSRSKSQLKQNVVTPTSTPIQALQSSTSSSQLTNIRATRPRSHISKAIHNQPQNPSTSTPVINSQTNLPPAIPHVSVSLSPNIQKLHGINFQVGGRGKKLTISEEETLYSLLKIGVPDGSNRRVIEVTPPEKIKSATRVQGETKKNEDDRRLCKGKDTTGNFSFNLEDNASHRNENDKTRSSLLNDQIQKRPNVTNPAISNDQDQLAHGLLKNKSLDTLLKLVHRKSKK